jgi:hypothetical protein
MLVCVLICASFRLALACAIFSVLKQTGCQETDSADAGSGEQASEAPPPSDEFADTGEEDTSLDSELQDVDAQLRKLLPAYDKQVGTINFGSRGMTDQRNDFLEGTSGSKFGGPATSGG